MVSVTKPTKPNDSRKTLTKINPVATNTSTSSSSQEASPKDSISVEDQKAQKKTPPPAPPEATPPTRGIVSLQKPTPATRSSDIPDKEDASATDKEKGEGDGRDEAVAADEKVVELEAEATGGESVSRKVGIKVNLLQKPPPLAPVGADFSGKPPVARQVVPSAPRITLGGDTTSWEVPTPVTKPARRSPLKRNFEKEDDDDDGVSFQAKKGPAQIQIPPPPPMLNLANEDTIPLLLGVGIRKKESEKRKSSDRDGRTRSSSEREERHRRSSLEKEQGRSSGGKSPEDEGQKRRSKEREQQQRRSAEKEQRKSAIPDNFQEDYEKEFSNYFRRRDEEQLEEFEQEFAKFREKPAAASAAAAEAADPGLAKEGEQFQEEFQEEFDYFRKKKNEEEEEGQKTSPAAAKTTATAKRTSKLASEPDRSSQLEIDSIELKLPKPKSKPKPKPATKQPRLLPKSDDLPGSDFPSLPRDWQVITHSSGKPVYYHRASRTVTLSRPYTLDAADSASSHLPPAAAIPCLDVGGKGEEEEVDDAVTIKTKVEEKLRWCHRHRHQHPHGQGGAEVRSQHCQTDEQLGVEKGRPEDEYKLEKGGAVGRAQKTRVRKLEPDFPVDEFNTQRRRGFLRDRMEAFYRDRQMSDATLLHRWSQNPQEDKQIRVYPTQVSDFPPSNIIVFLFQG